MKQKEQQQQQPRSRHIKGGRNEWGKELDWRSEESQVAFVFHMQNERAREGKRKSVAHTSEQFGSSSCERKQTLSIASDPWSDFAIEG